MTIINNFFKIQCHNFLAGRYVEGKHLVHKWDNKTCILYCSYIAEKRIRFNRVRLSEGPCYHIFRGLMSECDSVVQLEKLTGTEYKRILTTNIFLYKGSVCVACRISAAGEFAQLGSSWHSLLW